MIGRLLTPLSLLLLLLLLSCAVLHVSVMFPQVVVREEVKHWYHFLTTTCAIIGGVFTVAGILDSILYQAGKFTKKVELGKQG
jgi:hypothetical protein